MIFIHISVYLDGIHIYDNQASDNKQQADDITDDPAYASDDDWQMEVCYVV